MSKYYLIVNEVFGVKSISCDKGIIPVALSNSDFIEILPILTEAGVASINAVTNEIEFKPDGVTLIDANNIISMFDPLSYIDNYILTKIRALGWTTLDEVTASVLHENEYTAEAKLLLAWRVDCQNIRYKIETKEIICNDEETLLTKLPKFPIEEE